MKSFIAPWALGTIKSGKQCRLSAHPLLMHSITLSGSLSNVVTQPYGLVWSCCTAVIDKSKACHIWLKQSLTDPIALSPRLQIRFPSSLATCRISRSNTVTWPHWPVRAHYLICFLCGGVKLSVKLSAKHYTCLLEQAWGREPPSG